jgi:hypothetical protein
MSCCGHSSSLPWGIYDQGEGAVLASKQPQGLVRPYKGHWSRQEHLRVRNPKDTQFISTLQVFFV